MNILTTENLKKIYKTPSGKVYALDGVSVSVSEGEFIAVVGSSGSGKTTFLNMIGGLDRPTAGQVQIRSKPLGSLSSEELTVFRRRNIGFVFQNYNLLPYLNVWENITLPLRLDGVSADEPFIAEIIKSLGLEDKTCNMPYMLSGGQQQRVAIARALSTKPAIILADEPTGNLDSITGIEVIGLLKTCAVKYHQTIVVVTHNEEIAQMSDRIIRIEDGKVTGGADEK
ncbi:MAG: ABC transporter ATP-binding protein [Clostridiales bacterium]|nr:ABC transporter ATP-binding protein [Clostridiales bacterium]